MPTQIVSTTSVEIGTRLSLAQSDDAYVRAGVLLASIDSVAIASDFSFHVITIAGEVYGQNAIGLGDSDTTGNSVVILQGGAVTARVYGIDIIGENSNVTNYGTVTAYSAITLTGANARLMNYGTINATLDGSAIRIGQATNSPETAPLTINHGIVNSTAYAYYGDFDYLDNLQNFGTMTGDVSTWAGADRVLNRGLIVGDVSTGNGADVLDNRHGRIEGNVNLGIDGDLFRNAGGTVTGTVFGNDGDDTMIGNATDEDAFDGGTGTDTLDFGKGPAVTLALDGSFDNDGAALGDSYSDFEQVIGSTSADMIRGDAAANTLSGLGGADMLDGAGGTDTLRGGNGADILSGGLGNDTFRFQTLSECGDTITDFFNIPGNNDRFQIVASAFGGGLVAGVLAGTRFQTRADNIAQDDNDRFIFRTTDQTLWFDADGNGTGNAILVADLQSTATVTAVDITLI